MGSDEYVMVPREPTEEMHEAAFKHSLSATEGDAMNGHFVAINAKMYRAMLSAAPPSPPSDDGDKEEAEAYELGKRDGFEEAVQTIDQRTGGDGEFYGSTIPGRGQDVPSMLEGIVERFDELRSPRSDDGEGQPVAWVIGGENEGRGAFVTKSRDVMEVAKARDLLIQPLFAAPPSPTPSGEVGELARLLNAAADAFERDAEDGFEAGERADLWDQVVEVPLKDVRQAASLLLSLDAERARMRTALKSAKRLCDNINEFGHVTDQVFHDEAEAKIRSALPASDEK